MTWQQYPDTWLCTLDDVKMRKSSSAGTGSEYDNDQLSLFVEQASADIIRNIESLAVPHIATFKADWSRDYVDYYSRILNVYRDTDILEIASITNGNGSSVASSQYTLKPNNSYPKHQIQLNENSIVRWRPANNGNYSQVITIVGTFGNVPHYDRCWKDTGVTLTAEIASATVDTITVSSVAGYSKGNYIQIGTETLFVESVDTDANILTVERGVLGTTAATHANGSAVKTFVFKKDLQRATAQWAQYLYDTKDKIGDDIITFNGGVTAPRGMSPLVINAVAGNMKKHLDGMIN